MVLLEFWWDFVDKPSTTKNANWVPWSTQISKKLKNNMFWNTCESVTALSHWKKKKIFISVIMYILSGSCQK